MDPRLPTATIYCRQCGYALVGLSENRCPECGREFDPGNRKTFARSAWGWRVRWWGKRAALVIGPPVAVCLLAATAIFGNLYWHWRAEQPLIAAIRQQGGIPSLEELANPWDKDLFYRVFSPNLPLHETTGIGRVFLDLSRRVVGVEYSNTSLKAKDLDILAQLPWLKFVWFIGTHLEDGALAPLEKAAKLRALSFSDMSLSPDDLVSIGRTRSLHHLGFTGVDLDAAELASLQQLPALTSLWIQDQIINDSALEHIGQIAGLEFLYSIRVDVTDGGLRHLSGLTRLEFLYIDSPQITDEGLRHLSGLAALKTLSIDSARITGSGLVHLKGLPLLRDLTLARCPVTDDALVSLKDWPSLETLSLDETAITDAAAPPLAAIRTLRNVLVTGTQMNAGCRWLRSVRKDLWVGGNDSNGWRKDEAASQPAATLPSSAE